jgi:hypothetical protein
MTERISIAPLPATTPLSPTAPAAPNAPTRATGVPPAESFGAVLRALGTETARGERLVDRAVRAGAAGTELSNGDVIALQAGIYRYVEVVDLTSKIVDRAAQSVKQVTQGQG